jgi:hypothetical protein
MLRGLLLGGGLLAGGAMQSSAQTSAPTSIQASAPNSSQTSAGAALPVVAAASARAAAENDRTFRLDELELLPLESGEWERAGELDSVAHGAALAERAPGGNGEADENSEDGGDDRLSASSAAAGLSYAGLASRTTWVQVDGLSAEQSFRGGPRGAAAGGPSSRASFGEAAIGSLRVMPRSFSAQSGGAGGVIAVTTRGGGDGRSLWGSAFLLTRESALAATNQFSIATHFRNGVVTSAAVKPGGTVNEVGLSVGTTFRPMQTQVSEERRATPAGAPGSAARLAVFASLEAQVRDDHIVSTPAMANFYALSPEQVALLGNRGVTTAATAAALDYLDSLTGTTARTATRLLGFGRVDWRASERDEVTLGFIGNRLDAPSGAALGQASDAVVARGTGSLGDSYVGIEAGTGRWVRHFSPRWSNNVRGQVAHDLEYETPHAPLAQEPAIAPGGLAPQVSIAPNGFAYGTPANLGRTAYPDEVRLQVADTLEARVGRHLLTLGGDWSRVHDRIAALNNGEGSFLYDSGSTNGKDGGLVDWITDYTFNVHAYPNGACPSITATVHDFCFRTYMQSFSGAGVQTEFVTHEVAAFAEDTVRLRGDLTVTAGARYEYLLLPLPQAPNLVLDDYLASASVGAATGVFPEDRNNVGPRISVAWSPRGWVTVHAGYGLFFGRVPGATLRAALTDTALPTSTTRVRITPTTITQCPQVTGTSQGFGYPCAFTSTPPAAVAQTTSATLLAGRFRMPAVQRGSLQVERALGRHASVRAEYAMALAVQLPSSVDVNIAPATSVGSFVIQGGRFNGETFAVPVYSQRRVTQYGPVTEVVSNANATYHAGTVEAQWRGAGVELRGSYTFSRAIDYGPQLSATPALNEEFDPFVPGYDKGLGSLNLPQRFTGSALWSPHVAGAGARRALDGWRVAAIAVAGSGAPYSYGVFGGTRLSGGHETLNGSGGATWLPTVGRNTLRLPPRGRVDLRVGREFRVGRVRFNAFAEAFNLLNTQSVSSVDTRAFEVGTAVNGVTPLVFQDAAALATEGLTTQRPFGTPNSSTTGLSRERQVEFGVRLQFSRK